MQKTLGELAALVKGARLIGDKDTVIRDIAHVSTKVLLALFVMLGHFVIGFIDDYIKVVLKRNLGLKARQKLLGQIIMCPR